MLPRADIWSSAIKRHFPPVCEKTTPITIDCNCQSSPHCNTADCRRKVPLLCLSSPPSACVARHPSDVGLIHYIRCVPHTHIFSDTQMERHRKERKAARRSLYSLPTLILFIQWICFSLRNPPLISFHLLTLVSVLQPHKRNLPPKKKKKLSLPFFTLLQKLLCVPGCRQRWKQGNSVRLLNKKKKNSSYQYRA